MTRKNIFAKVKRARRSRAPVPLRQRSSRRILKRREKAANERSRSFKIFLQRHPFHRQLSFHPFGLIAAWELLTVFKYSAAKKLTKPRHFWGARRAPSSSLLSHRHRINHDHRIKLPLSARSHAADKLQKHSVIERGIFFENIQGKVAKKVTQRERGLNQGKIRWKNFNGRNVRTISLIYGHLLDGMKICRNDG